MTANISPDAMRALRPYMDSEHVSDEELRDLSRESGVPFEELQDARDALWTTGSSGGDDDV